MRIFLTPLALLALVLTVACGDDDEAVGSTSPTPAPSSSQGTIAWEDAVELIEGCEVTSVMQAHSRDVYLTLDDGAELHTVEPQIDLVLSIAGEAMEDCGPITMATE